LVILQSGLCEYGTEGVGSVKGGEFLNQLKKYYHQHSQGLYPLSPIFKSKHYILSKICVLQLVEQVLSSQEVLSLLILVMLLAVYSHSYIILPKI